MRICSRNPFSNLVVNWSYKIKTNGYNGCYFVFLYSRVLQSHWGIIYTKYTAVNIFAMQCVQMFLMFAFNTINNCLSWCFDTYIKYEHNYYHLNWLFFSISALIIIQGFNYCATSIKYINIEHNYIKQLQNIQLFKPNPYKGFFSIDISRSKIF